MGYKHLKFDENSVFLVTGGAGFIGSNLCEAILDMGYRVRCLDDLSTGKQENVDMFLDRGLVHITPRVLDLKRVRLLQWTWNENGDFSLPGDEGLRREDGQLFSGDALLMPSV